MTERGKKPESVRAEIRKNGEKSMLWELDGTLEDGFLVRESTLEEGRFWPPHWHDYLEWELITDGRGTHVYNGKSYSVGAGSAYLITYGDFHALRADTQISLINVRFSESVLSDELNAALARAAGRCTAVFPDSERERLAEICRKLAAEKKAKKPFYELICRGLLNDLIISLLRQSAFEKGRVPHDPSLVQSAVALILRDFRKDLTVSSVAKTLCVSANYLGSSFHKATGVSFNEYLNRTRLKYACALLSQSDMPVKQIAFEAGYASPEYFLYVFRRFFDMTPGMYRAMEQKREDDC